MRDKRVNKLIYTGKRLAKSLLSEFIESFMYLLHISCSPLRVKFLYEAWQPEFKRQTIAVQIHRLYKRGFISKIRKRKNIFISLRGDFWELCKDYITIKRGKYSKRWDGKWRFLLYDIPEKMKNKRNRLRNFIRNLGFGMVQKSSWISPYDFSKEIYEFSQEEGILSNICLYEGKFFVGKDIDRLVKEVWDLDRLFIDYQSFIDRCKKDIETVKIQDIDLKKYYRIYYENYASFRKLLEKDPFLPRQFLKRDLRNKAESIFNRLASFLLGSLKVKM